MASSPHHARPAQRRTLMRAGIALSALGVTLVGGAQAASAAEQPQRPDTPRKVSVDSIDETGRLTADVPRPSVRDALHFGVGNAVRPLKDVQPNPLAGTPVDPLSNTVGTQVADFKPVSTAAVTKPLSDGDTLGEMPVVGDALRPLPG